MKKIFFAVLVLMAFVLSGCGGTAEAPTVKDDAPNETAVNGDLKISMLDVGQGDAILIQTGKQTILIDTSDTDERDLLVRELEKFSVTKIDKLILTHPHADHIGSAKALINPSAKEIKTNPYLEKISVAEVFDNGVPSGSPIYKSYVKAVSTKKISHKSLKAGDELDFGNGVKFSVLYPTKEVFDAVNGGQKSDPNNESIVGKLTYKKFSMMFTGDAEKKVEDDLDGKDAKILKCDVLKAGHHGSKTSSSKKFIDAVNPSYVLISCGPEEENRNTYGHPHREALKNYLDHKIPAENVFCTRWNGTITVISDGKNFSVKPEKSEAWLEKWMQKK